MTAITHRGLHTVSVSAPRVEGGIAVGLGTGTPRLSWTVQSEEPLPIERVEFEIKRDHAPIERVVRDGAGQLLVPWPSAALRSRERASVRLRLGAEGHWSSFSDPTTLEAGLLEPTDWSAEFIAARTLGGLEDGAPAVFTDIDVDQQPVRARLYVTARGLYDVAINGRPVTQTRLNPGWTAYEHRLHYQTYDVTHLISAGRSRLSALLGNGWYRGQLVWPGHRSSYGERLALRAQLEITYADGAVDRVVTGDHWSCAQTGILFDDLYDGERRDLRLPLHPTADVGEPVDVLPPGPAEMVAPTGPPVRPLNQITPTTVRRSPSGAFLIDFGQNLVGHVRLTIHDAEPGAEVRIRHAEVLEDGQLGTRPLRSAQATCGYVVAGRPTEVLEPLFTFHGFRYAEITGLDDVRAEDISAVVVGSDLKRTGWFDSSDSDLNQLHANVVWSMRGNFLSLPTDCPQRDERLGWTGDIAVFAPTANFLFDTAGFLQSWLGDLAVEQRADGGVPNVVPDVLREPDAGVAGWGDAATVVPMALWRSYGDLEILRRQYRSMQAWVDKIRRRSPNGLWDTGPQLGDWLDPTAPPEHPDQAQADPHVVATACYAKSVELLADAARALNLVHDADRYDQLRRFVVAAYNRAYVTPNGQIHSDCQTVYAQALVWNLLGSETQRAGAGARLAQLVQDADYRVSTGFLGTPLILDALTLAGRVDLATAMLFSTDMPSWLYAVKMGATTIWERWDSMLPDGSINPGSMTSFNHYAYGSVADWIHRVVGGLQPLAPGYQRIRVAPLATDRLHHAEIRHESPYGLIEVRWQRSHGLELELQVPFGVEAEVQLPGWTTPRPAGPGHHRFEN